MDCSLPGSTIHGILQARILEWVAMPISRRSSQLGDQTQVSYFAGRFLRFNSPQKQKSMSLGKSPLVKKQRLWCWRRLLRVPWTAGRSNQSILKEISPEHSLEGLKLKLQYFGYLMQGTDSLKRPWERLKAGGQGDDRG